MSMVLRTDIVGEKALSSTEYDALASTYERRLEYMVSTAETPSDETACVLQAWGIRLLRTCALLSRDLEALR